VKKTPENPAVLRTHVAGCGGPKHIPGGQGIRWFWSRCLKVGCDRRILKNAFYDIERSIAHHLLNTLFTYILYIYTHIHTYMHHDIVVYPSPNARFENKQMEMGTEISTACRDATIAGGRWRITCAWQLQTSGLWTCAGGPGKMGWTMIFLDTKAGVESANYGGLNKNIVFFFAFIRICIYIHVYIIIWYMIYI
jgi:hypothetical protein